MSEEKRPRTSILAIASMVMGIMTVTFGPVTGIPAIILAVVTLFLISKAKGRLSGREYAIAGLVLAAVIIPIRYRAAEVYQKRLTPVCLNNIQRVSLSILLYTTDYDDKYPPKSKWCDLIDAHEARSEYPMRPGYYQCPNAREQRCGYAYSDRMPTSFSWQADDQKTTLMIFDAKADWNTVGGAEIAAKRHQGGLNVAFADGHATWYKEIPGR